ncbi:hypothetical protein GQF61_14855 [Sphingobacterium sp. DK4209]|uniref:Cardiolipin synthase N-terminal domain-containing protein n=1 Tax=Sphingobacterium zhuxiongii TaxID=2662364 RepID=A0A5Q0QG84_9SPHI|nr:hypothetical protein [Sphingobacterium sp. DK4209]QGA26898.1 hypothetical protein GFH32_11475 [Sphingobacterium sp. dk4302]
MNDKLLMYQKFLWILVLVILNILGCLLYLIIYDQSRIPKKRNI